MLIFCIFGRPVGPHFLRPEILAQILAVIVRVLHIEIARKIAVVIRSRVCCIIPVEGTVAVESSPVEEGCGSLQIIGRSCSVLHHENRLKSPADTGIAHLTVLIAPVGVVHIVTHQIIHFLGGSILCSSLSRSGESVGRDAVHVVDFLLHSCIVGE